MPPQRRVVRAVAAHACRRYQRGLDWGHEGLLETLGYGIPASHQRFAHALIDHGFDLVHGHSSHHAKGIELHRGKLVLYGCGDLLDDYEGITGHEAFRGDLALMYLPELDSATGRLISLEMLPLQIRRFRLNRASPGDAAWLAKVIARESARLGTAVGMRGDGRIVVEAGGT